eukprot:3528818-Amphidinium_carterae.1
MIWEHKFGHSSPKCIQFGFVFHALGTQGLLEVVLLNSKVQTLEQQKANIWRQRSTVMQQWTGRLTT